MNTVNNNFNYLARADLDGVFMLNYKIWLYTFYTKRGDPETSLDDMNDYINTWGFSRFVYAINHQWVWDVRGYDNHQADGPCVFIEFNQED